MRYPLFFMVLIPFYLTSKEVDIRLAEPASTVIIARQSGAIITVPLKKGDNVTHNSVLLSIKNDTGTTDVISMSNGIIKQYGESIKLDSLINLGDFIVEIQESQLKGILSVKNGLLDVKPFFNGETYCCMKVGNMALDIQIDNQRKTKDMTTYFFSIVTTETLLLELINNGSIRNMNISFKQE